MDDIQNASPFTYHIYRCRKSSKIPARLFLPFDLPTDHPERTFATLIGQRVSPAR